MKTFRISELFELAPGKFHATSELDPGDVPLISCGAEDNGVIGYFDIEDEYTDARALTVSFNGAPLSTHFHPYRFGAKDDVAILHPIAPMPDSMLIYIAALLNSKTWRYSYGRKCYREKLRYVPIEIPVLDGSGAFDTATTDALLQKAHSSVRHIALESFDALLGAQEA